MLRQEAAFFNRISMWIDFFILCLSLLLAYLWAHGQGWLTRDFTSYAWILVPIGPVWLYLFKRYNIHGSIRRATIGEIVLKLTSVHIIAGLVVASFIYFVDKDNFSRRLYVLFLMISFGLLVCEKLSVKSLLSFFRRRGYNYRNILIVGTREKAEKFHALVEGHSEWGLRVFGFLQALENQPLQEEVFGHKVFGYASDLVDVCKTHPIDEVVFCLPKDLIIDAEDYLKDLEELGITVRMALDFYELGHAKKELSFFHKDIPILTFHSKCLDSQQLTLKRALDVLGALTGLCITAVLFPFIAFAIKRNSPGPIFFGQDRVGENGRIFKCWKFRSMYIDAEERKKDLIDQNEMNGAIFKIKDDPRITPVGRFLRKTSLDELPQFWNVLKGEMSLVGTRPPTPAEVAEYENWHRRRISIKPGISGMWQVSGRNEIDDFDEIVRLDLKYIDTWSIWLDIKILLKTVMVVFARKGSQ